MATIPKEVEADIRYKTKMGSKFIKLTPHTIYEYKDGKLSAYARRGGKHPYILKLKLAYHKIYRFLLKSGQGFLLVLNEVIKVLRGTK